MAIIAMLYGQSGTGKSTSIRNFTPNDVAVINVSGKPLPFRSKLRTLNTDSYERIDDALQRIKQPSIIIDDATYLMTNEFMRTAKISGYQKFTDMALNYYTLVRRAAALPEDKIVYFLGHSETDDKGNEKFKTVGKLLDEKVTLEGLYTIVLKTVVQDGRYLFATHNRGRPHPQRSGRGGQGHPRVLWHDEGGSAWISWFSAPRATPVSAAIWCASAPMHP